MEYWVMHLKPVTPILEPVIPRMSSGNPGALGTGRQDQKIRADTFKAIHHIVLIPRECSGLSISQVDFYLAARKILWRCAAYT
jgi:hypothetical protein